MLAVQTRPFHHYHATGSSIWNCSHAQRTRSSFSSVRVYALGMEGWSQLRSLLVNLRLLCGLGALEEARLRSSESQCCLCLRQCLNSPVNRNNSALRSSISICCSRVSRRREAHSCSRREEWSSLKRGESGKEALVCSCGDEEGNLMGEQVMFIRVYGTFSSERRVNSKPVLQSELILIDALVKAYCLLRGKVFSKGAQDFHYASKSSGVFLPPPTRTRQIKLRPSEEKMQFLAEETLM